jgi:hypothetical protein
MLTLRRDHHSVSLADDGLEVGLGSWFSPAARSTERSVTRGVTDQPLQPLQVQDRCVLGMRLVRGISDRAPLKPQSKDRSLCVRRRVVSRAGVFTRSVSQERQEPIGLTREPFYTAFPKEFRMS